MAIRSFIGKDTEAFWNGAQVLRYRSFEKTAMRKLQVLDAAISLNDLAAVPGNRLEKLGGDRQGQHSIRINGQWRVCFRWNQPDSYDVEISNHYD